MVELEEKVLVKFLMGVLVVFSFSFLYDFFSKNIPGMEYPLSPFLQVVGIVFPVLIILIGTTAFLIERKDARLFSGYLSVFFSFGLFFDAFYRAPVVFEVKTVDLSTISDLIGFSSSFCLFLLGLYLFFLSWNKNSIQNLKN